MAEKFRVTYATMSADNEELQTKYDEAAERMKGELGKEYPFIVNGEERWTDEKYEEPSPIDSDLIIGRFSQATPKDVDDAVAAAKGFQLEWDRMGWQKRVEIMRNVANIMEERLFDLAALMAYEVGKSRLEALGDVQETAELIRWNADEMEKHEGFRTPMSGMGAAGDYYDVLRPYGVWAVISPFNFPMALSGGPTSGALVAGNAVVLKPSNQGALMGYKLYECYRDGGVPPGAFHLTIGRGALAGDHLWKHPDVGGITFTGSYPVGMDIYKHFATEIPKPVICEMGGKNPAIVTEHADLQKAAEGVARSAFGFGGQKCSACSRAFVAASVYDAFLERLVAVAQGLAVGDPTERATYMGPLITAKAKATHRAAHDEARSSGRIVFEGKVPDDARLARGHFAPPVVVDGLPDGHRIWRDELFAPLLAVAPTKSLGEAIARANDTEYGLTAGIFSEDESEVRGFFDGIEAGVTYANRRTGATTGAWPGVQPFGGWKASGSTGKGGCGPWYVQQFLREQSRTIVR
jgi:1-pyrroline-5-carboxylate dehydrogenase